MNFEWREDYSISVGASSAPPKESSSPSDEPLSVSRYAPPWSASDWGIYNHFVASVTNGNVVRVVPRFLFGLTKETVDEMYGADVDNFPIIGIFTSSTRFDRVIIQAYMNIVTLSVIFLLYANNPPETIVKSLKKTN